MPFYIDLLYACVAAEAFAVAFFLVPHVLRLGSLWGFVDPVIPGKSHVEPKVRCGGIAIYAAFVITLLFNLLLAIILAGTGLAPKALNPVLGNIPIVADKLVALFSGGTLLFLTGLVDDRRSLKPEVKLIIQILAALPLVLSGITIRFFIPGQIVGAVLTICWVVLLSNSFNFIDNMDGLCAGVASIVAFNFYLVSHSGGEYFMMGILAVFIGSVCGFLWYNFPNAQLFMGDSGSLFVGYMIAALSTMVTYYKEGVPTQIPVIAPLVILGVPLFDTASVMYIRWRLKKPFMKGDQNHLSHRLVALGFSRRNAVLFIYLLTFTVGLSAVNLRFLNWAGALIALAQVILFFVIIYFLEAAGYVKQKQ